MGLKSSSMGTLLQGVNQQPERVRLDGQVTEQINLLSDVTTGLSTRPGSLDVAEINAVGSNPKYQNIVFKGNEYIISWDEEASGAKLQLSSLEGTDFTVIDTTGTSLDYIGENMVFTAVEDQIVATNRDKIVKVRENTVSPSWRVALFQALGGQFLKTYEVNLSFSDGQNSRIDVVGTYTTPDGTGAADGAESTSEYIIGELVTSLLADTNLPAGTEITQKFDVASVYHPTRDIEITLADGTGGTILRGVSQSVKDPEDLPRYAPNGKTVEVTNSPVAEDNYWLKFETINDSFGVFGDLATNGDFETGDFTGWGYTSLSGNWSIVNEGTVSSPSYRAYLSPINTTGDSVISHTIAAVDADTEVSFEIEWVQGDGYTLILDSPDPDLNQITITLVPDGSIPQTYTYTLPAGYTSVTLAWTGGSYSANAELYLDNLQILRPVVEDGKEGFGTEGVWRETFNPYQDREFDLSTMPHVISLNPTGSGFVLSQGPWISRPVGDSLTAPFASIVDKSIRDAVGFEGRLALLTPDTLVMSRTNKFFDLWRQTATFVTDTDVIDIKSTKKNSLGLTWLVPFDRDLFIMSDPGDSQFIVVGGGLTPSTASMVLTTEFEMSSDGARPQSTGRTILFPFSIGSFSGVKEFYTSTEVAVNAANTLTETQPRYIVREIKQIEISQNFNIAMFRAGVSNTIWVYKYLWDSNEVLQSSWSKWEFRDEVRYMFFVNNRLYLISRNTVNEFYLHYLDLNRPAGTYGYTETLDRRRLENASTGDGTTTTKIVVQGEHKFIKGPGTDAPGEEAVPTGLVITGSSSLAYLYEFDINEVPLGADLIAGHPVEWSLEPTQAFGRDYQQRIDTSKNITVQEYVAHVFDSGRFKAYGTSLYGDNWEYDPFQYLPPEVQLSAESTVTGAINIPWGERADWSTFVLRGSDIKESTIIEVEWIGQVINTKGRRQ